MNPTPIPDCAEIYDRENIKLRLYKHSPIFSKTAWGRRFSFSKYNKNRRVNKYMAREIDTHKSIIPDIKTRCNHAEFFDHLHANLDNKMEG